MTTQTQENLVSCIIVTFNNASTIETCLEALFQSDYPDLEVFVIDNASSDRTTNILLSFKDKIQLIENQVNIGLSAALNQGIIRSKGASILVLNPDAGVLPNSLSCLAEALYDKPNYGSATPKLIRNDDVIDCAGIVCFREFHFYNRGEAQQDIGQFNQFEIVFGATGACALHKKEMLESIKLNEEYFDETFFVYKEDVDLSWRANHLGWKTVYVPLSVVKHNRSFHGFLEPGNGEKGFPFSQKRIKFELKQKKNKNFRFVRSISFRNNIFLIIKNLNASKSILWWLNKIRGFIVTIVFYLVFEPFVFTQTKNIVLNLRKMYRKRKLINTLK